MRPEEQLVIPVDVTPACELGSDVHLALIGVRNLHDHPQLRSKQGPGHPRRTAQGRQPKHRTKRFPYLRILKYTKRKIESEIMRSDRSNTIKATVFQLLIALTPSVRRTSSSFWPCMREARDSSPWPSEATMWNSSSFPVVHQDEVLAVVVPAQCSSPPSDSPNVWWALCHLYRREQAAPGFRMSDELQGRHGVGASHQAQHPIAIRCRCAVSAFNGFVRR